MGKEGRATALLLALCIWVVVALPAQASAPSAVSPQAVVPTSIQPPAPSPGAHSQRPRPASSSTRSPKAPIPQGTWSWQNPKGNGNPLFAISCPSATICYAAGLDYPILATINGGTVWTAQTGPHEINAISCSTATTCVAVGDFGLVMRTTNGGANWSSATTNSGNFLAGVSCPSTTVCFAVGAVGSVLHSVNGGANWTTQNSGGPYDLFAISCPLPSACVAAGAGGMITQASSGHPWVAGFWTPGLAFFGVSCASAAICRVVGQDGVTLYSTDGGISFTPTDQGPIPTLTAVTCPIVTSCFAADVNGNAYAEASCGAFSGNQDGCWQQESSGETGVLYAITCSSTTVCLAAGDYGMIVGTTNGGSGWRSASPNAFGEMNAISCATTSVCIAVGAAPNVVVTTDGGATWSLHASGLGQSATLTGISCPSTTTCFAVASDGTIITTSNGGATWSAQSSGVTYVLRAITCPSTSVCLAVGDASTILATADGGAHWVAQSPGITAGFFDVSCPSSSVCYVTGSMTTSLGTVDGGAHWSTQGSLGQSAGSISCPSVTTCYATGSKIHITTDGGVTWTDGSPPDMPYGRISCASTTACTAIADGTVISTSDGSSWATQTTPAGSLYGLSCPSSTMCFAAGATEASQSAGIIVGTTDGGATPWHWLAPSGTTDWVLAVSCPTATTCLAVDGYSILRTTNAGVLWVPIRRSSFYGTFTAIDCPSVTVCVVVGSTVNPEATILGTTDGGDHWVNEVTAGSGIDPGYASVSCPTTTTCYAASPSGTFVTTVDGSNWSAPLPITSDSTFKSISCPSTSVCFAADSAAPARTYSTTDGGANWNLSFNVANDPNDSRTGPFDAIDCPSATVCYTAGAGGLIATTSDGGANWRTEGNGTSARLTGISCPTVSECFISSDTASVSHSINFGGVWQVQYSQAKGVQPALKGLSCASTTMCTAVGDWGAITATTNGGAAWTVLRPAESTADVDSISCYGSSNCYTAGNDTLSSTHNSGTNWTTHVLTNGDELSGISCPGVNTCFAVGWPGAIYTTSNGGTNWTPQASSLYGSDETLMSVSCASATFCSAVGTNGRVMSTSNGITWSVESSGTLAALYGVSCPAIGSCVAVGQGGLTLTRSGGSWHPHASGTTHSLAGVHCPTTNTCYAVGVAGTIRVTTNLGATWSARASGTTETLYGVACEKPSYCVADGSNGIVLATVDGATWKPILTPTFNWLRAVAFPDLNHAWLGGAGGTILANPALIPSCTSVSITPDVTSPKPVGTVVTLNASAAGCPDPNPSYRFYLRSPSGVWSVVKAFSPASSFVWDTKTYVPGTYLIGVWVKDAKSGFTYDAYAFGTFTLQRPPCISTNVTSDVTSPQPVGTTVNFSASVTGCPVPIYQWWVNKAGVWTIVPGHDFAHSSSTFAWSTAGLPNGTYQVGVWAKEKYSPKSYEAFAYVTFTLVVVSGTTHCQAVYIDPSTPSPVVKGADITFTATPVSCDTPEYKWWLRNAAGVWSVVANYPGTNTYTLSTASPPAGTYLVGVWVRQAGSTASYEAFSFITYTVTNPPAQSCTSVNISPDVASPQSPGTVITFTAVANGCDTPNYKFFIAPPGGTFAEVQPYGPGNTLLWNTAGSGPGPWQIGVWARQAGSTANYQSFAFITYQLTFG